MLVIHVVIILGNFKETISAIRHNYQTAVTLSSVIRDARHFKVRGHHVIINRFVIRSLRATVVLTKCHFVLVVVVVDVTVTIVINLFVGQTITAPIVIAIATSLRRRNSSKRYFVCK
jgi:hypothetical protein